MPKVSKKIVAKKNSAIFSASLKFGELEFSSVGNTILECLNNLKFDLTKTAGVLTIKGQGKTAVHTMYPLHLKRLLVNKTYRAIMQKQLTFLMK